MSEQFRLEALQGEELYRNGSKLKAEEFWQSCATKGNAEAHFILANHYLNGGFLSQLGLLFLSILDIFSLGPANSKKYKFHMSEALRLGYGPALYGEAVRAHRANDIAAAKNLCIATINSTYFTGRTIQAISRLAVITYRAALGEKDIHTAYFLRAVALCLHKNFLSGQAQHETPLVDMSDLADAEYLASFSEEGLLTEIRKALTSEWPGYDKLMNIKENYIGN